MSAYNVTDGTMPETRQLLPSTSNVVDAAFIQTVPGRDFLVALRLYGAEDAFYDQTWKPDDIVKVK
jgi:hypothetical protein